MRTYQFKENGIYLFELTPYKCGYKRRWRERFRGSVHSKNKIVLVLMGNMWRFFGIGA